MPERRSGVDLIRQRDEWAVVCDGKVLSLHADRAEAIAAARRHSRRVRSHRLAFGQSTSSARLLNDRRRHRNS